MLIFRAVRLSFLLAAACLLGGRGPSAAQAPAKKIPFPKAGSNVFLEIQGEERRVLVQAYVCLRMGQLEQFMTRKRTKEHEAILAADVDARHIHAALLAAGAKAGKPVQYRPKYTPASGTPIKITLEYKDKDKTVRAPAQQWIRNIKTKKDLEYDWVFAGSVFYPNPFDKAKEDFYAANDGDIVCISNFDTAMLDLPIVSSKDNDELAFEAHAQRIPAIGTPVLVIFELLKKSK